MKKKDSDDGWEYSKSFSTSFHHPQQQADRVRRRLWNRKLSHPGNSADLTMFDVQVIYEQNCLAFLALW